MKLRPYTRLWFWVVCLQPGSHDPTLQKKPLRHMLVISYTGTVIKDWIFSTVLYIQCTMHMWKPRHNDRLDLFMHSSFLIIQLLNYSIVYCFRLRFFQRWAEESVPDVFWFSGLFFPHTFLTGIRQNYARQHTIPIDRIFFQFKVGLCGYADVPRIFFKCLDSHHQP